MHARAMAYCQRGWAVVPLCTPAESGPGCQQHGPACPSPGKRALVRWGDYQHRAPTEEDVRRWWGRWPMANVGVLTGRVSGLLVVDVDGADARARLAGRGSLPPTATVLTGRRGGQHLYFVYPEGASVPTRAGVLQGVDVRADGGLVVAPPSRHASGATYAWDDATSRHGLAEPPQWLLELVAAPTRKGHGAAPLPERIVEGARNATLTSLAGSLRRRGASEAAILAALQAENAARCDPPLDEAEVARIARSVARYEPGGRRNGQPEPSEGEPSEPPKRQRPSQADLLVALAEHAELFRDQYGAAFALADGEPIPLTDRNGTGGDWLRRLYWQAEGKPARSEAVSQALDTLRARARFEGPERELHVRAAWHAGTLYYELRPGRVVRVTPDGWTIDPAPPVLFRHYPNAKPLPDPEPGGCLDALGALLNVRAERDRRLLTAAVVTATLPHIARPIIEFTGPQGSGKTFGHRVIKRLLDPATPETVRLDPRDALQKASHVFVVLLDNAGSLPDWTSDLLCRLVTGEGDAKRRLYSDDDDIIYELRRVILLNGLNSPSVRPDLQDRVLPLELVRLADEDRREEDDLWGRFERERPRLLGALFATLASAMRAYPAVRLPRLPRLADWGRWAAAVYEALGWGAERFLADWAGAEGRQHETALDGSLVAQCVLALVRDHDHWQGSVTALYAALEAIAEALRLHPERNRAWPKSPAALSRRLREVEPVLGARGVRVQKVRTERGAEITITRHGATGGRGRTKSVSRVSVVSPSSDGPVSADAIARAADDIVGQPGQMPSAPPPDGELKNGAADATDDTDGIFGPPSAPTADLSWQERIGVAERLLELGQGAGWPRLRLGPWLSIAEGQGRWERFAATASPDLLRQAIAELAALGGGGEGVNT